MEGEDLWRCVIISGGKSEVSSHRVFECGGELCGLRIIGIGEAEVRTGRGFGNKCICEAGLGCMGVSSVPVCSMATLSILVGLTQWLYAHVLPFLRRFPLGTERSAGPFCLFPFHIPGPLYRE
jgi:hypothetical protein